MNYITLITYSILLTINSLTHIKPNLCINCKYFIPDIHSDKFGKCSLFPKKDSKITFLVSGIYEDEYYFCSTSRNVNEMCGEEGKYYKEKE